MKQISLSILAWCALTEMVAYGTVYRVPTDYPSIQEGLNAAAAGDTILVTPGTYIESVTWPDMDDITLQRDDDSDRVYIRPRYNLRGLTCSFSTLKRATLRDINIVGANCDGPGGGVYFGNAVLLLDRCRIADNRTDLEGGGGMFRECLLTLNDCLVENNFAGVVPYFYYDGAGLYFWNCTGRVQNSIIRNHESAYMFGGGIYCNGGITFEGNFFQNNQQQGSDGYAGGAIFTNGPGVVVSNNIFTENLGYGSAVAVSGSGVALIVNNLFYNNQAGSLNFGAIFSFSGGRIQAAFNTFDGNGTAVSCYGEATIDVHSSIFIGHDTAIYNSNNGGVVTSDYNTFWNNGADYEQVTPGANDLVADPLFVSSGENNYYLSQIAAGQDQDSPCVDSANPEAAIPRGTTRTDGLSDAPPPDRGYHYPIPETATPTPIVSPTPFATDTPSPGFTETPTPQPSSTPIVKIHIMTNSVLYHADDPFELTLHLANHGSTLSVDLFVVLDPGMGGTYYCWPSWSAYPPDLDHQIVTLLGQGVFTGQLLAFRWPADAGNGQNWRFHAALTNPSDGSLVGLDFCEFSFE